MYRNSWRFIRRWVCHNHKIYYSYVILTSLLVYNFWFSVIVGYYRSKNYHRSLPYAIQREEEWQANKPDEDDDDLFGDDDEDDEDEEEGATEEDGDDDE